MAQSNSNTLFPRCWLSELLCQQVHSKMVTAGLGGLCHQTPLLWSQSGAISLALHNQSTFSLKASVDLHEGIGWEGPFQFLHFRTVTWWADNTQTLGLSGNEYVLNGARIICFPFWSNKTHSLFLSLTYTHMRAPLHMMTWQLYTCQRNDQVLI